MLNWTLIGGPRASAPQKLLAFWSSHIDALLHKLASEAIFLAAVQEPSTDLDHNAASASVKEKK